MGGKQLCGAYKAEVKLDEKAAAAREEKKKDLEVVRSARSFFKTVDKQRSESMSAVPRIRFRTEEEVSDSYTRGNRQRVSQFEPGKIHSKFSDIFGQTSQEGTPNVRPPKKKLITLDEKSSGLREEISSLNSTPVKARWQQPAGVQERPRSMEVHKLDLNQVFGQENKSLTGSNQDISKELEEIRDSRPTPVTKRWRPSQQQNRESAAARSQSAHSLRRTRLPDDAWVVEEADGGGGDEDEGEDQRARQQSQGAKGTDKGKIKENKKRGRTSGTAFSAIKVNIDNKKCRSQNEGVGSNGRRANPKRAKKKAVKISFCFIQETAIMFEIYILLSTVSVSSNCLFAINGPCPA